MLPLLLLGSGAAQLRLQAAGAHGVGRALGMRHVHDTADLKAAMSEIAQVAYQAAGGQPGAPEAGEAEPQGGDSDGVIDAEFEETN